MHNRFLRGCRPLVLAAAVADPEHDPFTYQWELLPESTDLQQGGDRESRPAPLAGRRPAGAQGQTTLTAPTQPGAYRLFGYAHDGHGNVATGNVPFLVRK